MSSLDNSMFHKGGKKGITQLNSNAKLLNMLRSSNYKVAEKILVVVKRLRDWRQIN